MTWLLDSNALIRHLNGRSPQLRQRILAADPLDLCTCSVVRAELRYGAARSRDPQAARVAQDRLLAAITSLPFDDDAADIAGELRAELARQGTPIGMHDLQIAAIALEHGLTVVTHNVAEFSRVPGLSIEDWELPP